MKKLELFVFSLLLMACFSARAQGSVSIQSLVYASQTKGTIVSLQDGTDFYERMTTDLCRNVRGAYLSKNIDCCSLKLKK